MKSSRGQLGRWGGWAAAKRGWRWAPLLPAGTLFGFHAPCRSSWTLFRSRWFLRQIILCFCSSGKTSNDGEHSFSSVIIPNISLLAPLLSRNHFHFYVCSLEQSSLYTSKYFNIHYLQFYYSSKFSAIIPHYFSPGPSWPLSKSLSLSLSLSSAIIPNISLLALLSQNHFHFHVFLGYYPQHFSSGHSLSKSLSLSCLL